MVVFLMLFQGVDDKRIIIYKYMHLVRLIYVCCHNAKLIRIELLLARFSADLISDIIDTLLFVNYDDSRDCAFDSRIWIGVLIIVLE